MPIEQSKRVERVEDKTQPNIDTREKSGQIELEQALKEKRRRFIDNAMLMQRIRRIYLEPWFMVGEYAGQVAERKEKDRASKGAWTELDRTLKNATRQHTTLDDPFGEVGKNMPQTEISFEHDLDDSATFDEMIRAKALLDERYTSAWEIREKTTQYHELVEENEQLRQEMRNLETTLNKKTG